VSEAVANIRPQQGWRLERVIDQLRGVRDDAMRVHIDVLIRLPAITTSSEDARAHARPSRRAPTSARRR